MNGSPFVERHSRLPVTVRTPLPVTRLKDNFHLHVPEINL